MSSQISLIFRKSHLRAKNIYHISMTRAVSGHAGHQHHKWPGSLTLTFHHIVKYSCSSRHLRRNLASQLQLSQASRTMLWGSAPGCEHCSQAPNMRNTAQVVLPVPERPRRMTEQGGSGRSFTISSSSGDSLKGKSTSLSFMPCIVDGAQLPVFAK